MSEALQTANRDATFRGIEIAVGQVAMQFVRVECANHRSTSYPLQSTSSATTNALAISAGSWYRQLREITRSVRPHLSLAKLPICH
jgi:hypothetical protein